MLLRNRFDLADQRLADGQFVHVGYAIQKITPQEAQSSWEMLDLMLAEDEGL